MIISLGPNCRTAWNVKHLSNDYRPRPFDWWICPTNSMLRMLDREFEFTLEQDQLVYLEEENVVYSKDLNVFHNHDFSRDDSGKVVENFADEIPDVIAKYRNKFDRFWRDLESAKSVTFIVGGLLSFNGKPYAPDWDKPIGHDALALKVRQLVDHPNLEIVFIEITNGYKRIGIPDDGSRPVFLPPRAYQHPLNVFEEGFAALQLGHVDSADTDIPEGYDKEGQVYSLLARAGNTSDLNKKIKYLDAAKELGPEPSLLQLVIRAYPDATD